MRSEAGNWVIVVGGEGRRGCEFGGGNIVRIGSFVVEIASSGVEKGETWISGSAEKWADGEERADWHDC